MKIFDILKQKIKTKKESSAPAVKRYSGLNVKPITLDEFLRLEKEKKQQIKELQNELNELQANRKKLISKYDFCIKINMALSDKLFAKRIKYTTKFDELEVTIKSLINEIKSANSFDKFKHIIHKINATIINYMLLLNKTRETYKRYKKRLEKLDMSTNNTKDVIRIYSEVINEKE